MESQEFVPFIFTKENIEKFQSICEEMGLDDNGLIEFFFKLHEKNKHENNPLSPEQHTAETLPIGSSGCDLSAEPQTRLVDQESGETAKVLISLQDYQADVTTAVTEDQQSQECVDKILDISEKSIDQTLPEQVSRGEEFVVQNLVSTEVENKKRKNSPKSNPGGAEQKRKRRNDVWLTRVQDADFEERRYKCNFCSAAFFHPHHLQRHAQQLHKMGKEVKPNQCKDCFKTFATQLSLKFHQDFACRMVQRPYRCPQCQLGFKSTEEVESHKCSGNPAKPLCCMDCDYRTGSPRDLEHHRRIHTGERCYKCEQCDFRTAWKKNLKEHVLKHSGLKPFVCHVCNFATNDRSNLRTHLAKHLKNKLNLCHTCGTTFRGAQSLETHMLSHSYAAPHKCTYCDYTTRYKISLKSHMKTHNVENNDADMAQILTTTTTTEDGTVQEVSEISVETTDPDWEIVEKQFYMCQECCFVIDNRKLFDSHKCKVRDSTDPTNEMIIQILESPAEPPAIVET